MAENISATISGGRGGGIKSRFSFRSFREFTYKKTPQSDLEISVYFPHDWNQGDKRPGILFFFGGRFSVGTRHQFARQCTYLASKGMVAATADYRVHTYHDTGIVECFDDAFDAMRWFCAAADSFGIDPDRIAAGGGSAGGTLAAGVAVLSGFGEEAEATPKPNALVLYNPAFVYERSDSVVALERYAELGLTDSILKRISMADKISDDFPPAYVWFGDRDQLLTPAKIVIKHIESLGGPVDLDIVAGADHGFYNDYEPFYSNAVRAMDGFLQSVGYINPQ